MSNPGFDFDALLARWASSDRINAITAGLEQPISQAMDALQCPDPDSSVTHLWWRETPLHRLLLKGTDLLLAA